MGRGGEVVTKWSHMRQVILVGVEAWDVVMANYDRTIIVTDVGNSR